MPFITADIIQAGTISNLNLTTENFYLATNTRAITTGGVSAITGTDANEIVVIHGELAAKDANTIRLTGDSSRVTVGESGLVSNLESGGLAAVYLQGDGARLDNAGEISGGMGVYMYGGGKTLHNTGLIQGYDIGEGVFPGTGVYFFNPTSDSTPIHKIDNFGTISGKDYSIFAGESDSFTAYASETTLNNFGVLNGSVDLGAAIDVFNNRGTVNGDVEMGGGTDTFDGRGGMVNGTVSGGDGDDTYFVSDHKTELFEDFGVEAGVDEVRSEVNWKLGADFENLHLLADARRGTGNAKNNVIEGNDADNRLRGRAGNDIIEGRQGNDKIMGNWGDDHLSGGEGDDLLRGQIGNDILIGDYGNDRIVGGKGSDTLTGGEGEDVFVFNRVIHSKRGGMYDTVTDFEAGIDRIDLSNLNLDLKFIGTSGLSGTGDAEARLRITGAKTTVQVDVDGDGSYDMRIDLNGSFGLTEADFIL